MDLKLVFLSFFLIGNLEELIAFDDFTEFLGFHATEKLYGQIAGNEDNAVQTKTEVKERFSKLFSQLDAFTAQILDANTTPVMASGAFNFDFKELQKYVRIIEKNFKDLSRILPENERLPTKPLNDYAARYTSNSEISVKKALHHLNRLLNAGLFNLSQQKTKFCNTSMAISETMYQLINYLIHEQIKGFLVVRTGYDFVKKINNSNVESEKNLANKTMHEHISNLVASYSHLKDLSRYSFNCQSRKYELDRNYFAFKALGKACVTHEANLQHKIVSKQNNFRCSMTCEDYDQATFTNQWNVIVKIYKSQFSCSGDFFNCRRCLDCQEICINGDGGVMKYDGKCNKFPMDIVKPEIIFHRCDYCLCENNGWYQQNWIYQGRIDAPKDHVITGVRFRKEGVIIYLQIQTGKLLPYGFVNESSLTWQPVDIDTKDYGKKENLYARFVHERRDMLLGDLEVASSQVLTGIRFAFNKAKDKKSYMTLTIFGRKANLVKGIIDNSGEGTLYRTDLEKTTVKMVNITDKIGGIDPNAEEIIVDGSNVQAVKFQMSNITVDLGQTTVPFFDGQDLSSPTPMAQAGLGLFLRRSKDHAGYVTPRLKAIDMAAHLATLSKEDFSLEK